MNLTMQKQPTVNQLFYINLDGVCHSGTKVKEQIGRYLGKYLIMENSETKEQEFTFPELLKDFNFWKKHKNKRVNRGRRYSEE